MIIEKEIGGFDDEKENYAFNSMDGVGNYPYCMWEQR